MALTMAELGEAIGATICVGAPPGPTQILERAERGQGWPLSAEKEEMLQIFTQHSD